MRLPLVTSAYAQIFKIWRVKRYRLFLSLLQPAASDVLLDVGGYPGNWTLQPQPVSRVDTMNVHAVGWTPEPGFNIRTLVGDGCALEAGDRSYNIAFSNSVIEHVGDFARQRQFAAEIRRVGDALWVQTPAYECPIEPHYLALFVHYLPPRVQKKLIRWFTLRGWLERPDAKQVAEMVDTTRLLRKSEMRELFPDCQILTERLLGVIPKSYIAYRRKAEACAGVSATANRAALKSALDLV